MKIESEVAQSCPIFLTQWTAAYQPPPSMGFSRQEYRNGVPLPSPYLSGGQKKRKENTSKICNFVCFSFLNTIVPSFILLILNLFPKSGSPKLYESQASQNLALLLSLDKERWVDETPVTSGFLQELWATSWCFSSSWPVVFLVGVASEWGWWAASFPLTWDEHMTWGRRKPPLS